MTAVVARQGRARLSIDRKFLPLAATIGMFAIIYTVGFLSFPAMRGSQPLFNLLITQPFLLRLQRPDPGYWLMSIYAYEKSFGVSEYGLGSAIAVIMLLIMIGVTFFYVRQMIRIGEVR